MAFGLRYFCFKQRTAYEVRISDWSSDVCSSDLIDATRPAFELSQENTRLKAELAAKEQAMAAAAQRFDGERAKRATLIAGAGLLSGGVILGLLLPWLLQNRRRRRYGDF